MSPIVWLYQHAKRTPKRVGLAVSRTDSRRQLPPISRREVEGLFDDARGELPTSREAA